MTYQYQQPLLKKIQSFIKQLLSLQRSPSSSRLKIQSILRQIIRSQQFTQWIVLRQILDSDQIKRNSLFFKYITEALESLIKEDQTLVMKVFLYGFFFTYNIKVYTNSWSAQWRQLIEQGKHFMFNSWLTECEEWNAKSTIETVNMLVGYFPVLVKKQYITIGEPELQLILSLTCYVDLKKQEQFQAFDNFLGLLKMFRLSSTDILYNHGQIKPKYQGQKEEHIIIKNLLQILANGKHCRGNVGWLFFPSYLSLKQIQAYFLFYSEQLLNYSQIQLVQIFTTIFQNSLQQNALIFFFQLSKILKQQQKYYELRVLYQKIVLPILIRRGKARVKLSELVLQISVFYLIGFYSHCDIGRNGLICMLHNINKIQQKNVQQKWIQLCLLIMDKNKQEYLQLIFNQLTSVQKYPRTLINKIQNQKGFQNFIPNTIWQICNRNAKKLKIYQKRKSKQYKGIQNRASECYIISVVQALFTTKELPRILKQFYSYKREFLSYNLAEMFKELQKKSSSYDPNVRNIKQNGPQQFALSFTQQDTQQYFIKLFQKIQQQFLTLKQTILLQQFKKSFKSTIHRRLQCQNKKCMNVIERTELQYIHTIPNRSMLKKQQVQQINDYKCEKCGCKNFIDRIKLDFTSKVLVVHINRFSFQNKKSRKELATHNIKRDFEGYRLKGIIFHIGKSVQCGHYVYYYNVEGKKWIEMNDSVVNQFMLENENEEFQLQMKAQMTPYLLFYIKKQK